MSASPEREPAASPFDEWTGAQALWAAARRAARGKRHRPAVAHTLLDLEGTVLSLERQLRAGEWTPGRATRHEIRDPKARSIVAAPFADRVVHQALCSVVGPWLERGLVADSYACRTGRGTHAALRRALAWARHYRWCAHLDVRKYFPSVDHALLLRALGRAVPCERTLAVCARVVAAGARDMEPARFHFAGDTLFTPFERPAGLPIGNLTSQHFANHFLSPVDHLAKDRLRVRGYLRYMDDLLLFGDERAAVEAAASAVEQRCLDLRLRLHPWRARPTTAGVTFLGFRLLPDCVRVKRSSVARAQRRLLTLRDAGRADPSLMPLLLASLRSTFAHWAFADSYQLRSATLKLLDLDSGVW